MAPNLLVTTGADLDYRFARHGMNRIYEWDHIRLLTNPDHYKEGSLDYFGIFDCVKDYRKLEQITAIINHPMLSKAVEKYRWTVGEWKFVQYIRTFAQYHWIEKGKKEKEFGDNEQSILDSFDIFREICRLGLSGNEPSFNNSISWLPDSYIAKSEIWDQFKIEVLTPAKLVFKAGYHFRQNSTMCVHLLTLYELPIETRSVILRLLIETTLANPSNARTLTIPDSQIDTEIIVSEEAALDFTKLLKYTAAAGLLGAAVYLFSRSEER